jgi:hypothetical protein
MSKIRKLFKLWRYLMALSEDVQALSVAVTNLGTAVTALTEAYKNAGVPAGTAEAIQSATGTIQAMADSINQVLQPPTP